MNSYMEAAMNFYENFNESGTLFIFLSFFYYIILKLLILCIAIMGLIY